MNFRQVHLDFHTGEKISGIGSKFDKDRFQRALKLGHVNSITVFAKCHHGYAYHPSEANEMHPGLKFDLLAAQIEAAHEIGVKTPVYISAGLDEKMARRHTDWLVRNIDESTIWVSDFKTPGYHKFCMSTPYLDYLTKQTEEVAKNYDADGIFFDIVGAQPCYCQYCIEDRIRLGLAPYDEIAVKKHSEIVYKKYAKAMRDAVDKYKPGLPIFQNGGHIRHGRRDLAGVNTHLEIESLPTGGWGYDHFPLSARYCQGIGMEFLGMTGKFHTSWGEFGGFKHPNALRYEVALSVANGAKCSVGDQLSPTGEMDEVTYKLIGEAYSELEAKEPWLDSVKSVADIAVYSYAAYAESFIEKRLERDIGSDNGVCRILLEGKYLFDFVDLESDFSKYKLIILPDGIRTNEVLNRKLSEFVESGGKILASGRSCINKETNKFDYDLGAEWIAASEYKPCYTRPSVEINGMGNTGYVVYEDAELVRAVGKELARLEKPYFNRTWEHFCSHKHTPNSGEYYGAGMTEGKDGIYIAWNVFTDYAQTAEIYSKQLVCHAIDRLLGENKTVITDLPAQGVTTLMNQNGRLIHHLLYAAPVRRGKNIEIIEDIIPIYGCKSSVKTDKAPKCVYLAPTMEPLEYEYINGRAEYTLPKLENHQMIVIEF